MERWRRCMRAAAWAVLLAGGVAACVKVPYTGRRQFNLLPEGLMNSLGESSYESMTSEVELEGGTSDAKRVKQIGQTIGQASGADYSWEIKLIQDEKTVNAWCLPGGKMAVYRGLLPVVKNEAGLAFVMGHEVGHAVAHHGAERMSQQLVTLGGLTALYLLMDRKTEWTDDQKAIAIAAMGAGAYAGVMLPFSRTHEKEADVLGIMTMAKVGYPPDESIQVWDRMSSKGSSSLPAWLSTHPTHEQRQENLRSWMQRARKRYLRHKLPHDTKATLWTSGSASSGGGKGAASKRSAQKQQRGSKSGKGQAKGSGKGQAKGSGQQGKTRLQGD